MPNLLTWDEVKSERNRVLRDLPFSRAYDFDWASALVQPSPRKDELRFVAAGYLDDRLHVICYVYRDQSARVISFRKANAKEARSYGLQLKRIPGGADRR